MQWLSQTAVQSQTQTHPDSPRRVNAPDTSETQPAPAPAPAPAPLRTREARSEEAKDHIGACGRPRSTVIDDSDGGSRWR